MSIKPIKQYVVFSTAMALIFFALFINQCVSSYKSFEKAEMLKNKMDSFVAIHDSLKYQYDLLNNSICYDDIAFCVSDVNDSAIVMQVISSDYTHRFTEFYYFRVQSTKITNVGSIYKLKKIW